MQIVRFYHVPSRDDFIRVHKSYLVAKQRISVIDGRQVRVMEHVVPPEPRKPAGGAANRFDAVKAENKKGFRPPVQSPFYVNG
jgi:hypothetical protein